MLSYLRVTNFALLDDVELTFDSRLNVITGETGAGKSLLLQAVSLLRGARANMDWVRAGAEEAVLEAVFHVPLESFAFAKVTQALQEGGISTAFLHDEGLPIRRVLNAKGKHRVTIAGQLSSVSILASVCRMLIDLSSQHESQALLDGRYQLDMLDQSGKTAPLLSSMATLVMQLRENEAKLRQVEVDEKNRMQREDWVRFQLREVEQVHLQEGEEESLRQEREQLRMAKRLHHMAEQCEHALTLGEPPVLGLLSKIQQELAQGAALVPALGQSLEQIREAAFAVEEAIRLLHRYGSQEQPDPNRLHIVEDRLYLIGKLLRKHGPTREAVQQRQKEWEEELAQWDQLTERRRELQKERGVLEKEACETAEKLSQQRRNTAVWMEEQSNAQLAHLALPHARLHIQLTPQGVSAEDDALTVEDTKGEKHHMTARGWDRCEFGFAPHPEDVPKPLHRIASGGELSRILLACKQVLGDADGVLTHVFDEVDAGLGGAVADQVGRQLQQLARTKQVLCVTHLAQVAARGHAHFQVSKEVSSLRSVTHVRNLNPKEREMEIARMAGAQRVTEKTKAYARELLRLAEEE